jgi:hypothetical protein
MSCHPHFDARCSNFLKEYLVQRRLHDLESVDGGAGVHDSPE